MWSKPSLHNAKLVELAMNGTLLKLVDVSDLRPFADDLKIRRAARSLPGRADAPLRGDPEPAL